jgi:hypothetical protein
MSATPETLAALLQRYCEDDIRPSDVPQVSLAEAVRTGEDPLNIVKYFASLGLTLRCLDDLMQINDDPDEEEVHSFRVAEGVAVTLASDGLWQLFLP